MQGTICTRAPGIQAGSSNSPVAITAWQIGGVSEKTSIVRYADVDKDGWHVSAPIKAASILGRGLADAVLRVAAIAT